MKSIQQRKSLNHRLCHLYYSHW